MFLNQFLNATVYLIMYVCVKYLLYSDLILDALGLFDQKITSDNK